MDNDLISRSALLDEAFLSAPATALNPYGGPAVVLVADIEKAPAVDAVEVVRCKDCRHCERMGYTYYCYCHHWSRNTDEDGYCYEGA